MIPKNFRRGEPRRKADDTRKGEQPAKAHESSPRRVLVAASISWYLKRRSDPISRIRNPAGRPAVAGKRAAWRGKNKFLVRPYLRHELRTTSKKGSLSVRQHAPDLRSVGRINLHRPAKMAHALRLFGAKQMALECVRAHDLAVLRNTEALGRAAMRF